ncbi:flagellar biosynthesis anti-sigma factor FlgM [Shewanella nanhaiensis]|uniref:Negative regulator of flagellin synthesis n=1 Tax=Shewanella nanhaiensis TaxID=2864872 RepID=A0ABS7E622_9GAMM|nr:flagellar biosynthesis anti-sigma factor FlgM [Shewanella nanhaiensis]MBW8185136.1 flagellar biosynthesis anti-sigma factor FlgM [Shewanella nanhaiensis]
MAIDIKQVNSAANAHVNKASANKTNTQTSQAGNNASSISTPPKSDSVSITSQAQQLQSIQAKLSDIPEVDKQKVAEIKLAIAEGRYKVDPEKLASNIAMFENELKDLN